MSVRLIVPINKTEIMKLDIMSCCKYIFFKLFLCGNRNQITRSSLSSLPFPIYPSANPFAYSLLIGMLIYNIDASNCKYWWHGSGARAANATSEISPGLSFNGFSQTISGSLSLSADMLVVTMLHALYHSVTADMSSKIGPKNIS